MLENIIKIIRKEVDANKLYEQVDTISKYHRIQASDGYREAANACAKMLQDMGIDANVLSYDANGQNYAGSYKLFQEWNCKNATCEVVYPSSIPLCDFKHDPISLIQKSYPCDYRKEPVDVIVMDKGHEADAYADVDFKGKMILIQEHFQAYTWAIEQGAIGYLSDFLNETPNVRTREDLYDSLNYTSFWWKHDEKEIPTFGFVISPRMGDHLRELANTTALQYKQGKFPSPYLKVNPFIDATLFDGKIEVVEAVLPGESDETILITAHLCHPHTSANDNASGVSGSMEVLRVLKTLQAQESLTKLKKTIKLILIPEFTGTYCYLCDGRDLSKYQYGINLDMIGGRQVDGYGPITITNLPHACPSFVDSLACLLQDLIKHDKDSFEDMQMSLVNTCDVPFQLGSDHFILSDPMVHIPAIMLGQWPDKHYHTSTDTLDKIDPIVLKYSTTLAATYVYVLANLEAEMLPPLLGQMRMQYIKEMNRLTLRDQSNAQTAFAHAHSFFCDSLRSLLDVLPQCASIIQTELHHFDVLSSMYLDDSQNIADGIKDTTTIPRRLFTTPITDLHDVLLHQSKAMSLWKTYKEAHPIMLKEHGLLQTLCDYYVDGIRDTHTIAKCVIAEAGYGEESDIYAYIAFMKNVKLMM